MERKRSNIKVGDRLPIFGGARVTDVRYAKTGAIGFEIDNPETLKRIDDALKAYAEAVREDQMRPREEPPRRNLYFDSPLD